MVIVSVIALGSARGQSFHSAQRIGGSGYDAGEDIVLDDEGNSYVTGRFSGTVDFDPGAGVFNLTSAGSQDAFVARYTAGGQLSWAIGFGGTGADLGHGIALDAAGNVYVMGRFAGTANFDPNGTFNLTSNGSLDTFVAKYTQAGTLVWAFSFGSTLEDAGEDLAVDPAGNVYLTGGIQGTVDFDPGPGVTEFTSTGDLDIFRAKYSTDGELLWAYVAPDAQMDNQRGFRIVVDDAGYSYITGWFKRNPVVGNVNGEQISSNGLSDAWIGKFDPAGNYVWAFNMGATARDLGLSIAVDNAGNTIGGGFIKNTVDFDPGPGVFNLTGNPLNNGYLAKYDPSGNLVWAFLLDNVSATASTQVFNIGVDDDDNYYVAGFFQGTVDFDPNGTFQLTGNGPNDGFLAKYDAGGHLVWAFKVGGTNNDFAQGVHNTPDGSIITMTGRFRGTADFSVAGNGTGNLTSAGLDDIFIARYDQPSTNQTPIAAFTATPDGGTLEVAFDGSASADPDGMIVDWDWDFGDGDSGSGTMVSHTYAGAGVYTVTLTVTDDQGKTDTASQPVTAGNPPPTASFTVTPVPGSRQVDVDASASTDNSAIVNWEWDFGDGGTNTGETASHTYLADGTYTIELTVTDDGGATDVASTEVVVVDGSLPPIASFSALQTAGTLDVAFDGSASTDPDGTIISWGWDFGDGGSGAGATASHSFAASGTYTVVLTVTDDEGLTGSATADIVVVEPGSDGPFLESGGLAVFEAEHFHANIIRGDHEWVEDVVNAGFSGESAMKSSPDTGLQVKSNAETTSPELSFTVDITTTGDYHIWGRVWAPNKNGNSIYIGFDGALGSNTDIFQTSTYGAWVWVEFQINGATVPHAIATAGLHTVHAWLRKDGMLLDKVVMTTDPDFTPTGTGPAESPRGPSAPAWAAAGQRATRGDNPLTLATVTQEMPGAFSIDGNYPNPFNPSTTLRYALPHEAHVRLAIYDTMGRQITVLIDRTESAGRYEVQWDGRADTGAPVASGVYLVRMQAGTFSATHTLLLAK